MEERFGERAVRPCAGRPLPGDHMLILLDGTGSAELASLKACTCPGQAVLVRAARESRLLQSAVSFVAGVICLSK